MGKLIRCPMARRYPVRPSENCSTWNNCLSDAGGESPRRRGVGYGAKPHADLVVVASVAFKKNYLT